MSGSASHLVHFVTAQVRPNPVALDHEIVVCCPGFRTGWTSSSTVVDEPPSAQQLEGIHVLIVEDDDSARHVLRRALESWGALVSVTTGANALRAALRADVVVVDLATAGAAGHEFLFQLQRLHGRLNRPVPIIGLASLGIAIPATSQTVGVQLYLMKPLEPDQLRAAVRELARE